MRMRRLRLDYFVYLNVLKVLSQPLSELNSVSDLCFSSVSGSAQMFSLYISRELLHQTNVFMAIQSEILCRWYPSKCILLESFAHLRQHFFIIREGELSKRLVS